MKGFPMQDTGPGMNELFHDLQAEQAQLSEAQRKLDASVSPAQARIDVDRERKALEDSGKKHPQPDGFINDYD
jgi:hypothetical protein